MSDADQALDPAQVARDRVAIAEFLLRLRRTGITDRRLVDAFEAVPRRLFVPHESRNSAYVERALPIDCGQTISAPELVALMTGALDVHDDHQVLEIGTGSGYQAAILARLARRVCTIERYRTLTEAAELRFRTLKITNITALTGDGTLGWPANATFDRIMVTAAAEGVPKALLDQLKTGGVLIAPLGPPEGVQVLTKLTKTERGNRIEKLADVRFVPLVPGKAAYL